VGTLLLNRYGGLFGFCFISFGFNIFCDLKQRMENLRESLQGDEIQASKTLPFLLVGVGLNVYPRQARPGRMRQTEAMAAPEMLLRQKKQDQRLPLRLWLGSSETGQAWGFGSALPTETIE